MQSQITNLEDIENSDRIKTQVPLFEKYTKELFNVYFKIKNN